MKILYIGPGFGSNMRLWLEYFGNKIDFDVYLLPTTSLSDEFKEMEGLRFVFGPRDLFDIVRFIKDVKKHEFDIIHVHGGYNKKLVLLLSQISKGKLIFNLWGQWFYDGLTDRSLLRSIYFKYIVNKSDLIFVNWWHLYLNLCDYSAEVKSKTRLTLWGNSMKHNLFYDVEKINREVKYSYNIEKDDFFIFIPRGMLRHNNIHLIIESLCLLKGRLRINEYEKIKVLIKTANATDKQYLNEIEQYINEKKLGNIIIEEGIFSPNEYADLYSRADLSIYMSNNDMLTNAIVDGIYSKTNLILSDISPYMELKNRYDLDVTLSKIGSKPLSEGILTVLLRKDKKHLDNNLKKVGQDFVFEKNIEKTIRLYNELISGGK
ncbi:hypothetical protein L4C39_10105 [Vibrio clamense]|uniref:hypothetical protein n=1 Tax=Vibrio clamense TaxID=2910254 RepID=UPI003D20D4B1